MNRRVVVHNHLLARDARRPYDPANREYTGREPVASAIKNHPGVQEVEISQDSDYKYEVFLKEGWCWRKGRNAGGRTGFFHNVVDFHYADPIRENVQRDYANIQVLAEGDFLDFARKQGARQGLIDAYKSGRITRAQLLSILDDARAR